MKIFFAGTTEQAARMLNALKAAGHDIVGVLTRVDARVGRKGELLPSPVAKAANQLQLPLYKANAIDHEVAAGISALTPDLGFVLAYGAILKDEVLELPKYGWLNLHYSLLPKYRGAAPVQHAILEGAQETGVTLFSLDSGVDTGPILSSAALRLTGQENTKELLDQLTDLGINLSLEALDKFQELFTKRSPQNSEGESLAGKISRDEAKLDFHRSASELHNLVRAMNPEPMAWFEHDHASVRVLEASLSRESMPVGIARLIDKKLHVGCGSGSIVLLKVQPAGKSIMDGADWFRGLRQEAITLV